MYPYQWRWAGCSRLPRFQEVVRGVTVCSDHSCQCFSAFFSVRVEFISLPRSPGSVSLRLRASVTICTRLAFWTPLLSVPVVSELIPPSEASARFQQHLRSFGALVHRLHRAFLWLPWSDGAEEPKLLGHLSKLHVVSHSWLFVLPAGIYMALLSRKKLFLTHHNKI